MKVTESWYFGPVNIFIEHISHNYIPVTKEQIRVAELIREDVKNNGLLNPIDLIWDLDGQNSGRLQVRAGN